MSRDMTLGEATEFLTGPSWGCACPGPSPICHCARATAEARVLQRGAHIVAKQLADLAEHRRRAS